MSKELDVKTLSGKHLTLWQLLRKERGVSEPEGAKALGWARCGATLLRLRRAAERAGYAVTTSRGRDGRTRWRAHRPRKPPALMAAAG